MRQKIFRTGMLTVRRIQDPYYQGTAAEIGFYFIFSIVPILALMLQVVNRILPAKNLFNKLLAHLVGNDLVHSLVTSLFQVNMGKTSILFIIIALWSASKIEFSMIRQANYTYGTGPTGPVGYFKNRIRAIGATVFLILLMVFSLLVLVFGNLIIEQVDRILMGQAQEYFHLLFSYMRWPLALVIYWFILSINYLVLPARKLKLRETIPGSLFAAVGILVATFAYYTYITHYSHLNLVYGSLATIIVLLLWFYWLGFILVVGMLINASWFGYGDEVY